MLKNILILLLIISFQFCSEPKLENPFPENKNPWKEIRSERIDKLLPQAMKLTGVDAWITICRENNNDPLAIHVGGENAVSPMAVIFIHDNDSVKSIAISGGGEATSLKEIGLHDTVIVYERNNKYWDIIAGQIKLYDPKVIAVNSSHLNIVDGISYTQRELLEKALGEKYKNRLISSAQLVTEWLSVKLPDEIEIMKRAAEITSKWEIEAYHNVIPGKTKDSDIAKFLKSKMAELGVEDAWSPDQNPSVNSGPDRGHSHATDRVIQPGDIIQTDFGIKVYGIWCSDIQRFAYVLKEGETQAPADVKKKFENAKIGHRKVLAAMRPGITGYDVDKVQREWMKETGSLPVRWGTGHPVGYWAHDLGPYLGGAANSVKPTGNAALELREGQVFAYDGFFSWQMDSLNTKTISVEEMAVIHDNKAIYISPPQEELILIGR